MVTDQALQEVTRQKVDQLRREGLLVPSGPIPPQKLERFWEVCSTATVKVTKKVAYIELAFHQTASHAPDHPAKQLRDLFYEYLASHSEIQRQERAPMPMNRDIRNALTTMGYGPKGKGKGKTQQ